MSRKLPYNIQEEVYTELQSLEKDQEKLNYLNHEISEQEIRQAVKKLKNKKSPFFDKIRNEMIKSSLGSLLPVYIKVLFSFYNVEKY